MTTRGLPLAERLQLHIIPVTESGCWIWTGSLNPKSNYGQVKLNGHSIVAHRAAWIAFRGPIPNHLCVLHHCDVRECVNPDHLYLGTKQDNSNDKFRRGRADRRDGENNGNAKLTIDQVIAIRRSKQPWNELATQYAIAPVTVWRVKRGINWK